MYGNLTLLQLKASTGSARNGNLVLAPNLFVRAKKCREICGRDPFRCVDRQGKDRGE